MPCIVDTRYEDEKWKAEMALHHKIVEKILEEVIYNGYSLMLAKESYEKERQRFAEAYEKVFTDLVGQPYLEQNKQRILKGESH